jgi:hypothetical protein
LPDNLNRAFLIPPVDDDVNDSDLALHAGGLDGGHPIAVRSQRIGQHRGVHPGDDPDQFMQKINNGTAR